ncbi:hypothetical protein [Dyadobacter sp. CY312]|uniref:hypothetical protein n=1 Tax=Dyadobacter sp. CY312 TaxID=2907303 RepID=UPI001F2F7599|nr:hypothetical protein [Dyadobacter sp. CY312]MCE7039191.1 hypothetical protein [Dyadobacter sp. CY312]
MATTYEFFEDGAVWKFSERDYSYVGTHSIDIYDYDKKVYHTEFREAFVRFKDGEQPVFEWLVVPLSISRFEKCGNVVTEIEKGVYSVKGEYTDLRLVFNFETETVGIVHLNNFLIGQTNVSFSEVLNS